jgi:hypothetical protein
MRCFLQLSGNSFNQAVAVFQNLAEIPLYLSHQFIFTNPRRIRACRFSAHIPFAAAPSAMSVPIHMVKTGKRASAAFTLKNGTKIIL